VITPLGVGNFGTQLKLAHKHEAKFAVIFGDSEMAEGKAIVKKLSTGEQTTLPLAEVAPFISK
jgi:histidyl-tRNA synthetase